MASAPLHASNYEGDTHMENTSHNVMSDNMIVWKPLGGIYKMLFLQKNTLMPFLK